MSKIFPRQTRVMTFIAFEHYHRLNPMGEGPMVWERALGDQPVHEIINNWLDETQSQIVEVSSPGVSMYNEDTDVRFVVTSVTVLYIASAERTEDECRQPAKSVGPVVGPSQPEGEGGSEVYGTPKTDRDPDVAPAADSG